MSRQYQNRPLFALPPRLSCSRIYSTKLTRLTGGDITRKDEKSTKHDDDNTARYDATPAESLRMTHTEINHLLLPPLALHFRSRRPALYSACSPLIPLLQGFSAQTTVFNPQIILGATAEERRTSPSAKSKTRGCSPMIMPRHTTSIHTHKREISAYIYMSQVLHSRT